MTEPLNNDVETRTRGRKSKTRRRFAAELADLQGRVDTAVRLLQRCTGEGTVTKELVAVAIATLTEE